MVIKIAVIPPSSHCHLTRHLELDSGSKESLMLRFTQHDHYNNFLNTETSSAQ